MELKIVISEKDLNTLKDFIADAVNKALTDNNGGSAITKNQINVTVPPHPKAPTAPQASVPVSAPSYTLDQLSVAATALLDAGKQQELISLLSSFGVQAMTQLPKDKYGEFATALRQLGAKI